MEQTVWKRPRKLDDCYNILDLRELAEQRLPAPIFHFIDGGAETEITLRRNTSVFDEEQLIPKCLVDVNSVKTSTRILGQDIDWPVFCSPTGISRVFHPEGEPAVARAAAKAGTYYSLAVTGTTSIEKVAAASNGPKMFQILFFKNRDITWTLLERCKKSGFNALCLTVDTPIGGRRERDFRTGCTPNISMRLAMSVLQRPGWLLGEAKKGFLSMENIAPWTESPHMFSQFKSSGFQLDQSATWEDLREMIEVWGGPFAVKGILSAEDARRAVDAGATTIIVSNHGGRQLDGAAAPFEALPEIAEAVGDQCEVILDGGIRRGVHVLKALARGAKACSIGRAYVYGLAAGGEAGVAKSLDILRSELVLAMKLAGVSDTTNINADLLKRFP